MAEKTYSTYNGSKIEYSSSKSGNFTQIKGLKTIPEIGGTPKTIDTTDLDNTVFETQKYGLKPAQSYELEFNMEDPSSTANFKVASDLEDSEETYYWKITYSNGIAVDFRSDVKTSINEGSTGDLIGFKMYLSPVDEPNITIPSGD